MEGLQKLEEMSRTYGFPFDLLLKSRESREEELTKTCRRCKEENSNSGHLCQKCLEAIA
jgi:hypothetical protein